MNKFLLTCLLILFLFAAKAQTKPSDVPDLDKIEIKEPVDSSAIDPKNIFTAVEMEPSFPGGIDRFFMYLQANIKYPENSYKNNIQGKVFVTFIVEDDGSLSHIKVLRGVSPDIDAEAIRVMSHSPYWKPGIQNGRVVRVQFSLAINFKLPPQNLALQNDTTWQTKVFSAVEKVPEFPGGIESFYQFLDKNLKYPNIAKENNIQGKVFLSFVVEKDGSLSDIKVVKSLTPETDAEAIRLMQSSPKWKPGIQNNRPVRVQYTMPIPFSLPSNN